MHRLNVEQRIEQRTGQFFEVSQRWRQTSDLSREKIYSITLSGKEQLEADRTHRASELAGFVEEGNAFVYPFGQINSDSRN